MLFGYIIDTSTGCDFILRDGERLSHLSIAYYTYTWAEVIGIEPNTNYLYTLFSKQVRSPSLFDFHLVPQVGLEPTQPLQATPS